MIRQLDLRLLMLPLLILCGLVASCDQSHTEPRDASPPVVVFAASSLTEVVTEIAEEWSRRTGQAVRTQFAATSDLARQIQEGASADIFIVATPEWLNKVSTLDRFNWLSNRLVIVVLKDAADPDLKALDSLALCNEQVPAGKYAKAGLENLKIPIPQRVVYGANVRDVLSKVAEGGAQAGVVYATDAAIDSRVRIAFKFPPESHAPIVYPVGLLERRGKRLFEALLEPWSLEIATRHGFLLDEVAIMERKRPRRRLVRPD